MTWFTFAPSTHVPLPVLSESSVNLLHGIAPPSLSKGVGWSRARLSSFLLATKMPVAQPGSQQNLSASVVCVADMERQRRDDAGGDGHARGCRENKL